MTTGAPEATIKEMRMFSREMMSVRTPRGGTYQVVLPDGSKVWLNAGSSLTFPKKFDKQARVVMLTGEAYFEIAKNPAQPFRVLTIGQHVTVLGTHFNVNAYRDELAPRTTLVEGSVNVSWANQTAILKPGQQAVMLNKSFKISKVNVDEVLSWKNGKFKFSNESIESLMRKISRWYDVDIEYRGEITKEKFGGQVSKFSKVSDILEVLQLTGYVHFKIEDPTEKGAGRRIVVLP
jgi:ferric-dicitrate binding protein FerR (iron transport regulator)